MSDFKVEGMKEEQRDLGIAVTVGLLKAAFPVGFLGAATKNCGQKGYKWADIWKLNKNFVFYLFEDNSEMFWNTLEY